MEILIATGNAGKAREFREMLAGDSRRFVALSDVGAVAGIEETGRTFRDNACLKASHYAMACWRWTLADDSGLEVDALEGKPGVTSARWAELHGAGKGDEANNALLLWQLADVPDERRTARFVCVLALADDAGRIVLTARDTIEGRMLRSPRGSHGFGYDPLFLVESERATTAELDSGRKHAISHRGKALGRMRELMGMVDLGGTGTARGVTDH